MKLGDALKNTNDILFTINNQIIASPNMSAGYDGNPFSIKYRNVTYIGALSSGVVVF